ncbi:MAG: lipid IV(A) 3-deoxy-D-manno-octulosonic acid transferase [Pseudomonadota bacterium]
MKLFLSRFFYALLLFVAFPYALLHLLWRARRQPAYLHHWSERFGLYSVRPTQPVIWLHAVSVGETRAAVPLVEALLARYPEHQILLTHTTPTGRATSESLFGERVVRVYLPYDYSFAARRFVRHFKPAIGLLMETEIWPNLIRACHASGTPVLLVNARLSVRSARRYGWLDALVRSSLGKLAAVVAQTPADAERLSLLGAHDIEVAGNLKFDCDPLPAQLQLGEQLRAQIGVSRPIFVAASTREGEEGLVLDALEQLASPDLLTMMVPRHPQRFDEVAALLKQRGVIYQRRSAGEPVAVQTAVLLGDTMGELFAYYRAADVAFVGGSLLPFGGQNLIEAAAVGCPVLIGPHTWNFTDVARQAIACGAAHRVEDVGDLARALKDLLDDTSRRRQMSEAAQAFSLAHRGTVQRLMQVIGRFLG